jgi:hypothetical protein
MSNRVPSATMSALLASMSSLSQTLHRFPCRVLAYRESVPPGLSGSFVAVAGGGRSLQVGLMSDPMGWRALSEALDESEPNSPEAMVHGASVLAAATALAFKAELPDCAELTLGMPLFVDGGVVVGNDTEVHAADVVLGSTRALLVLLDRRSQ